MRHAGDAIIGVRPDRDNYKQASWNKVLKIAQSRLYGLQCALTDLSHEHPFRGEYIRTLSENDTIIIEIINRSFPELVSFIEHELGDYFLQFEANVDELSMAQKWEIWARFRIIESPAQWQTISDLSKEISETPLVYSETTAKNLNLLVDLLPQFPHILDKFDRSLSPRAKRDDY